MIIEVHKPELEAIINQRMATGRFRDVEDALLEALQGSGDQPGATFPVSPRNLGDVFARAREILAGEELNLIPDKSSYRAIDLS